jgi:hypothetical protein
MKTNKKAILGMLVAMILSLGMMRGISTTKDKDANVNLCGIAGGCMSVHAGSEGSLGWAMAFSAYSNVALTAGGYMIGCGGPVGWVCGGICVL